MLHFCFYKVSIFNFGSKISFYRYFCIDYWPAFNNFLSKNGTSKIAEAILVCITASNFQFVCDYISYKKFSLPKLLKPCFEKYFLMYWGMLIFIKLKPIRMKTELKNIQILNRNTHFL